MSTIELLACLIFWACLALVAYAYLVYPLLLGVLARAFGTTRTPRDLDDEELPSLSLLIAAYNEEEEMQRRLENTLLLDYPINKLEIVVASDGSSDGTAAIVQRFEGLGIRLLDFAQRRGKSTVLNASIPELTGDIILLSDANTLIEPQAARKLVRWFADPQVGVVCGRLRLYDPVQGRNADSLYWKYETFLKKCEGRLGALLGANGAIYAIRRELIEPIPPDTIIDDFYLPLQARLNHGRAIVYEPQAVAHEETPQGIGSEFQRRARIGAGGFQSMFRLGRLLSPRLGWTAFTFFSHKVVRWLCPFFLIGMLASNLFLLRQPLYQQLLLAQAAFYAVSLLVCGLPPLAVLKPLRLTSMFTVMNAALLAGCWRWLRSGQQAAWKRTERLKLPKLKHSGSKQDIDLNPVGS